jgi:hypothetical protein
MQENAVTPKMFARASGISLGAVERLVAADPTLKVTTTMSDLIERGTKALGIGPPARFWYALEQGYRADLARGANDTSTSNVKGIQPMTTGSELIAQERQHQIEKWGTRDHDTDHTHGELARAAVAYVWSYFEQPEKAAVFWPFPEEMHTGPPHRDLVKAGALIAAELDRLGDQ